MSNKERVLQLIEGVPDTKLVFVVNILESMKAYANEDVEPDEWDLEMIVEAEKEKDKTSMPLDEFANELKREK